MTQNEALATMRRRHRYIAFAEVVDGQCVVGLNFETLHGPSPVVYGKGATWAEALAADAKRTADMLAQAKARQLEAIRKAARPRGFWARLFGN